MELPLQGDFAGKDWTREYQVGLLNELHAIIKKHTIIGMGQAVASEPFERLVPDRIKRDYGGIYGLTVLRTVVWFGTRARKMDDWIHYFFEAGDAGWKQVNVVMGDLFNHPQYRDWFRIASWTFAAKKGPQRVIQLQPADFIAFEAYKAIENFSLGFPRPARKSYFDLIRNRHDVVMLWTEEAIQNWLIRLEECKGDVIESLIVKQVKSQSNTALP